MILTSTFGTAPRTFSTVDSLPPGLTLHASGLIDGTPTTAGVYSFTVTVTDSLAATCTAACTITIDSDCIPESLSMSDGRVGLAYTFGLTSPFGVGLQVFTTADALPPGLTLSAGGVVSGTPTTAGTYTFDVVVTDSLADECDALCTLRIISNCVPNSDILNNGTVGVAYI